MVNLLIRIGYVTLTIFKMETISSVLETIRKVILFSIDLYAYF